MRRKTIFRQAGLLLGVSTAALIAAPGLASADQLSDLARQNKILMEKVEQLSGEVKDLRRQVHSQPPVYTKGGAAPHYKKENWIKSGNDKIDVTISGQVNRAIAHADNGIETDTLSVDNDVSSTRLNIHGRGKLNDDLSVGAVFEFEAQSSASNTTDIGDGTTSADFGERKLEIYAKSKTLGTIWLGQGSTASDGISEYTFSKTEVGGNTSNVAAMGGGITFRTLGGAVALAVDDAFTNLDGFSREDRVRYDTPTLAGFVVSTSWNADDEWDVALRYAGEFGAFNVEGGVAYGEAQDDFDQVNASLALEYMGFFATVAGGERNYDMSPVTTSFFYATGGYNFDWSQYGGTAIGVDYFRGTDTDVLGDESTAWGVFATQKFDDISTEVYLGYRNYEYDDLAFDYHDVDYLWAGARLKF